MPFWEAISKMAFFFSKLHYSSLKTVLLAIKHPDRAMQTSIN